MPTRLPSWQLFAVAVLIWGTTWHAILYQLAGWPPEYGVALRFGLAALTVFGVALWRGDRLRLPAGQQQRVAVQGIFMYGLAYLCVYHGERHVPSGLVAVGYATSPLLMGLGAWMLWRSPLTLRFGTGGLLGVVGVALIFAPELATVDGSPTASTGLAYTVGAVLLSAVGALSASRNAHHGLPFWPTVAWGLAWGAGTAGAAALLTVPLPQAWPTSASWWLSLAYLAVAGTVVAFGAFLTLQHRLGPAKASTVGVMTPVVALVVSAVFEGFRPGLLTLAGAGLTVLGNVLMLRR